MVDKILYNLLDKNSFDLKINEGLSFYKRISDILSENNIPILNWKSDRNNPGEIEMSFSINCNFQDVYILAYLLKDFGLESIYPSRNDEKEIRIGTYLYLSKHKEKYSLAPPLSIDTFLKIDPKLSTKNVINAHFENWVLSNDDYDEDNDDDYDDEGEREIEEAEERQRYLDNAADTFDFLSDGQDGSYYDNFDYDN